MPACNAISHSRLLLLATLLSGALAGCSKQDAGEVSAAKVDAVADLSLIHISEPTRPAPLSRMPSSA